MSATWYVHLFGENLGPLGTDAVHAMLKQNRLQYTDFIWKEGFPKWFRVMDVDDFASGLPAYPAVAIPSSDTPVEKPKKEAKAAQPAKVAKAAKAAPVAHETVVEINRVVEIKPAAQTRSPEEKKLVRCAINAVVVTGKDKYRAVNISVTGIFVQSPTSPELGSQIKFKLEATAFEKPLEMTGVVTRQGEVDKSKGFAIEFTRVNPVHKRIIESYIDEQSKEAA